MVKNKIYIMVIMVMVVGLLAACGEEKQAATKISDMSNHYSEEEMTLPQGISYISDICLLNTGQLRLAGLDENTKKGTIWNSIDGGKNWEMILDYTDLLSITKADDHIAYLSSDGRISVTINKGVAALDEAVQEHENEPGVDEEISHYIIDEDKKIIKLTKVPEKIRAITFSKNGVLLGIGTTNLIFQQIFTLDETTGKILHTCYGGEDGVKAYSTKYGNIFAVSNKGESINVDLSDGKKLATSEDLEKMAKELNSVLSDRIDVSEEKGKTLAFYHANEKGIYRYYDNKVEQLVYGGNKILGTSIVDKLLVINKENIFLTINTEEGSKILHYTYSKEKVNETTDEITVFSLEESEVLKHAVAMFQQKYKEVKVNILTGVPAKSDIVITDAIKKLNIDVLAGKGPDVILFDGMSVDNYIKQGLLLDITNTIDEINKDDELIENIANTYRKDNKIFAIPAFFSTMVVEGDGETAASGKNLNNLVKRMQELATIDKQKSVFFTWNFRQISSILYHTYLSGKIQDTGKLTDEALTEFYSALKKIDGLRDKKKDVEGDPAKIDLSDLYISALSFGDSERIADGEVQMGIDYIASAFSYRNLINVRNKKNISYNLVESDSGKFFHPQTIIGINSKTDKIEAAKLFLSFMLTKEAQGANKYYGFPINKQALQESLIMADNGKKITENEQAEAINLLTSLDTPSNIDSLLMAIIMEQAQNYVSGKSSLDDAVKSASKKVKLYFSE